MNTQKIPILWMIKITKLQVYDYQFLAPICYAVDIFKKIFFMFGCKMMEFQCKG